MTFSFRPAKRENTPLIIGLAGPTKSGKSKSALELAVGLAGGGRIIMVNTEPHGHHYADQYKYDAVDIESPHRIEKYVEVIEAISKEKPAVLIFDTLTHLWDGLGGMKETKDEIALKMARGDTGRVDKMSAPAWAQVKADENHFIYKMLELDCHILLCFRAKDKMAIPKKGGGEWTVIPLQPIMSDRIAFETLFTLTFQAHAKGVPDLDLSELREPFDTMIQKGKPIEKALGQRLATWSKGGTVAGPRGSPPSTPDAGSLPGATGRGEPSGDLIPPEPWELVVSDYVAAFKDVDARGYEGLRAQYAKLRPTLPAPAQAAIDAAGKAAKARVGLTDGRP